MIIKTPLEWPRGQKGTPWRHAAKFKVSLDVATKELERNLDLLGATDVVLTRDKGLFVAVAVYFIRAKKPFVIACDTFSEGRHNIRAIGLTVEALRSIQRYGATSMLEQAFTGFAALPPAVEEKPWWEILGVPLNSSQDAIKSAYRELAKRHHPDNGGDLEKMKELNRAYFAAGTAG